MDRSGYPVKWHDLTEQEQSEVMDEMLEKLRLTIWRVTVGANSHIQVVAERDQDSHG